MRKRYKKEKKRLRDEHCVSVAPLPNNGLPSSHPDTYHAIPYVKKSYGASEAKYRRIDRRFLHMHDCLAEARRGEPRARERGMVGGSFCGSSRFDNADITIYLGSMILEAPLASGPWGSTMRGEARQCAPRRLSQRDDTALPGPLNAPKRITYGDVCKIAHLPEEGYIRPRVGLSPPSLFQPKRVAARAGPTLNI